MWRFGRENWGSRRGRSGMVSVTGLFQAQVPWIAWKGCYLWVLSLKQARHGDHARSASKKSLILGLSPPPLIVYAGSHQRALRKGSQLVLTLARAPPKTRKKEKQQRLMRIRRVVSHVIRPAPSPPEASRSTSNPPSRSPIITVVVVVKLCFVSCFCDLV